MKKIFRISVAAAAAVLTLVSCQRSELSQIFSGPKTKVTVGACPEEAEEATRTYIEEDASTPGTFHSKWSNSGEALGVIFGDISDLSQSTVLSAEETTDNDPIFTGELSLDDGEYKMFLFYPSSAYVKCYKALDGENEGTVGLLLNNVQHPSLGTFDPSCDLMGWSSTRVVVADGSLVLENIRLTRPMAIVRLVLNADDAAVAKGMTVTGVKMDVAAGASVDEAVVLTGLMKMSRMGTVTKWNTPYSYVEAEIDPDECITAGEAGFNEVFLIVNAATIPAGRKIFFTVDGKDVTGGDLQFRREVSKDDVDMTFQAGKINTIALKLRDKDLVQETGEFYEKVTSLDDLVEGDYLIVYEGDETHDAVAFNGGLPALDATNNGLAVTISDNKIASTTTLDAAVFTISPDDGTILSKSGLYIGVASNSNGLKTSEDASEYKNTFAFDENGNANIFADFEGSSMKLRFNSTSNQMRFRYFTSEQQPIALYASPYNVADTTPRITFEGDENGRVEKTVSASTTMVEFAYTKNKYVTGLPTATKYSGLYLFDGDPVVTDGKVTVNILPSTEEDERRIIVKMTGQGIPDEGVFLEIVQEAYVPGATSEDNPYSVAEAVEAAQELDSEGSVEDVYVKGIINRIATAYSSQHNNVSFYISDDGTTDGDELQIFRIPATSEADYTVGDAVEIKGVLKNYQGTSPELTATFEVVYAYKAPAFSPAPGIYTAAQNVTITAADGAPIYYTVDGSTPTASSSVYSSPISVSESKTIKAFTIVNGVSTGVVTAAYTIDAQGNDGSLEHPFTASEARELALSGNTGSYYITGIVTKIVNQYNASYGTANFWIDENGTAQDVFEGYKIKYFDDVKWVDSNAEIAVNDEVIIYGALTVFNSTTPETSSGYLVSLNGKTKGLTLAAPTITTNASQKQITVSWTAATGTSSAVSYVVTCGNQTYNATAAGSNTFNMPAYGTYGVSIVANASDAVSATIIADSVTLSEPGSNVPDPVTMNIYSNAATVAGSGIGQNATWKSGDITVYAEKLVSTATAFRNSDTNHTRFYKDWSFSVTSAAHTISSIEVTCTESSYANTFAGQTLSGGTATVSGSKVTVSGINASSLSVAQLTAQVRISSIKVIYSN